MSLDQATEPKDRPAIGEGNLKLMVEERDCDQLLWPKNHTLILVNLQTILFLSLPPVR